MPQALRHEVLKTKQRALRADFPATMALRVHRAISWIGRAERCGDDHDARFVFLWIAFNAAYAEERDFQIPASSERLAFQRYFVKLVDHDRERRIYDAIWSRFSGPVRQLMANQYVFNPFWQHHNDVPGNADWADRFARAAALFAGAFQRGETATCLSFVFDRLYVLRNQIVHGGSTWNSGVNRAQVRDGAAILAFLLPVFVDLMMDHPQTDWGRPFYPVVE